MSVGITAEMMGLVPVPGGLVVMAGMESLEPLGVWEMRDFSCFHGLSDPRLLEAGRWSMRHLRRASDVCRTEFYLLDSPFAVLWRYTRDERGSLTDVVEEPVIQALNGLPPAWLLRRS